MSKKHEMIVAAGRFLVVGDMADPASITEYKLDGVDPGVYRCSSESYTNQRVIAEYCWPVEAREELVTILTERQRLQKALDDSMGLVYQLGNKIARGELT